jgi:hypothetical protein
VIPSAIGSGAGKETGSRMEKHREKREERAQRKESMEALP